MPRPPKSRSPSSKRMSSARPHGARRGHPKAAPKAQEGGFWNAWRMEALMVWMDSGQAAPPWAGPKAREKSWATPTDLEVRRLRQAWSAIQSHRAMLDWHGAQAGLDMAIATGRRRVLAWLVLSEALSATELDAALGLKMQLTPGEREALKSLKDRTLDHPAMPPAVRANLTPAAYDLLAGRWGKKTLVQAQALNDPPPPLDLRVNLLRATPHEATQALAQEKLRPRPASYDPWALRLPPFTDAGRLRALHEGLVEVQDEGSQIAARLVDAQPGHFVIDVCAGAGGKTLAMGAAMQNKGRLVAMDTSPERLERAKSRIRRAGLHNVELRPLPDGKWLKRQAGRADRVLIDAPCSGSGSWRRKPEGRWTFDPAALEELARIQAGLLEQAAGLPRAGGRIIYVTCSLFREENENPVAAFLDRHKNYRRLNAGAVWQTLYDIPYPSRGNDLLLTPLDHGTDGFFVSILERAA